MPFGLAYDRDRMLLVMARDHTDADEDYQRFLDALERLDRDAHERGIVPVTVLLVRNDSPAPSATWRQRMADSASKAKCKQNFFGLVTRSALHRGVTTALRWLLGKQMIQSEAFDTFEAAMQAAERVRGEALPELLALRARAEQQLKTPQRSTG